MLTLSSASLDVLLSFDNQGRPRVMDESRQVELIEVISNAVQPGSIINARATAQPDRSACGR